MIESKFVHDQTSTFRLPESNINSLVCLASSENSGSGRVSIGEAVQFDRESCSMNNLQFNLKSLRKQSRDSHELHSDCRRCRLTAPSQSQSLSETDAK